MNERTKTFQIKSRILGVISLLLTVGPFLGYAVYGMATAEPEGKLALGLSTVIVLGMLLVNVIAKKQIRSTIWIIMLGLYFALGNITNLLIMITLSTILDEFIITPWHKSSKNKYVINREIDERAK